MTCGRHWLDVGEFLVAFSFAYDWLFDAWTFQQRKAIMWSMISLGLEKALKAYDDDVWFLHVKSNWNCEHHLYMMLAHIYMLVLISD